MDTLKKPISCGDNFIYKKLQYQPLETPLSNMINWKGDWVGWFWTRIDRSARKNIAIKVFKFLKSNQRISASVKGTPRRKTCVQGTPRRGNEHIAQGIALGMMKRWSAPWRGKSISVQAFIETLLPFQGAIAAANLPRALPWAMRLLGVQPAP